VAQLRVELHSIAFSYARLAGTIPQTIYFPWDRWHVSRFRHGPPIALKISGSSLLPGPASSSSNARQLADRIEY
jgi:hypothetical protein